MPREGLNMRIALFHARVSAATAALPAPGHPPLRTPFSLTETAGGGNEMAAGERAFLARLAVHFL